MFKEDDEDGAGRGQRNNVININDTTITTAPLIITNENNNELADSNSFVYPADGLTFPVAFDVLNEAATDDIKDERIS